MISESQCIKCNQFGHMTYQCKNMQVKDKALAECVSEISAEVLEQIEE